MARTCRVELRAGDQIGRIGGEEFLVVLHSATGQQAREIAERLRLAVERLELLSIASEVAPNLHVTISLGVISGLTAWRQEPRLDTLTRVGIKSLD